MGVLLVILAVIAVLPVLGLLALGSRRSGLASRTVAGER
jgi:hypothetical protein